MHRLLLFALFCSSISLSAAPHWVWVKTQRDKQPAALRHTFQLTAKPKTAKLRFVADFAKAQLWINGQPAGSAEPFGPVITLDPKPFLRTGVNELVLAGISDNEAAAMAVELTLENSQGERKTIGTSPKWKTAPGEKVILRGNLGLEIWWTLPPLKIDETDDYTQWKRASNAKAGTDPATFDVLRGYKVELLRSAGANEGSWVSMAFDPDGRLTVAREDKGLIRYSFSKKQSRIVKAETINDDLRECRGLLYAHKSLYVNANSSKGLYRLRDTNGDGKFDERKLLLQTEGGTGHGRNDLALGPDGKVYVIHGDSVHLPKGMADRMSPLRRKVQPFRINEGHVIRMNADGTSQEIFCGGLRNPYGIAFNPDGEPFTYDADAEFDMGTPWYRPTEVKHLTSGADFGWRAVTGSWPPYFPDHPDNTQASVNIGKGSPTGVKFGTKSSFPSDYQKAFYVLDWAYGRILAVHLVPRGSTYMGAAEVFLRGQPLNVTDLAFGPDGAMYFLTGGRRTQSALYRVKFTGPTIQPRAATKQESDRAKITASLRKLRRVAESGHVAGKKFPDYTDLALTGDNRIEQAWRIAFEHNPKNLDRLSPAPETAMNRLPVERLTTKANLLPPDKLPAFLSDWLVARPKWNQLPPTEQLAYLDLIRLCMAKHPMPPETRAIVLGVLNGHFPSQSAAVNKALAPLLIELAPKRAVPIAVDLLNKSTDDTTRIFYLHHLRHAKQGWTPTLRESFFRALNDSETFLGGRGLPQGLKNIRREAEATLTDAEKKSLTKILSQKPKLPPLPDLAGRKLVKQWKPADFADSLNLTQHNLANGKKVFHNALCSRCHRHGREGYPIGPDLTRVASRFGPADLLREILEPSRSIAENYHTTRLKLKDGRQLAGQIIPNLDYRAPNLRLAENPLHPDKITKIPKAQIMTQTRSENSIMPPGLLNLFTKDEILDLLAWLRKSGP